MQILLFGLCKAAKNAKESRPARNITFGKEGQKGKLLKWAKALGKGALSEAPSPWQTEYIQINLYDMLLCLKSLNPDSEAALIIKKLDKALLDLRHDLLSQSDDEIDNEGIRVLSAQELLMIGNEGAGTRVHLDWLLAVNLAIGLDVQPGTVVAKWLCCEGNKAAQSWLIDFCLKFLGENQKVLPMLLVKDMEDIVRTSEGQGIGKIWIEEQRSGEIFKIPCGTAHAVCNLHPCIKLALDGVQSFNTYAEMMVVQTKLISSVFFSHMMEDNGEIVPKLNKVINDLLVNK